MRTRITAAAFAVGLLLASTGVASAGPRPTIPPPLPGALGVAALLDGRVTLAKADAPVDLALQTLRVYAYESSSTRGDVTTSTSRAWIVRRPGASPVYGSFAPVTASGHAGAHRVVATVSQQQVVDATSMTYLPLVLSTRSGGETPASTTVRGSTILHVDALEVDGAAVDIGATCVTASAVAIALTTGPGWTDFRGGLLQGSFTVPPFTGCDAATPGTSALVTTAFSGRGNTVTLARGPAGSWDTTAPRDCRDCGRPPAIP